MAASFGLLLVASGAAIVLALQAADAAQWVAHTLEVRRLNQTLFAKVQDATLRERGYLTTEDPRYFDLFQTTKIEVPRLERQLQVLTHENAEARLLAERQARLAGRRFQLVTAMAISLLSTMMLALFVIGATGRYIAELAQKSAALADEMRRRESSEGQLRQQQKMEALGQLTGGVAHDFNNMLAIIIGNLDMLARRLTDDEGRRRFVDQALEGAQRAARLTQSLLAFSRQQPLAPKSVNVNRAVSEMSQILRSTLGEQSSSRRSLAAGSGRR